MAVTLNRAARAFAERLIADGKVVDDERDDWSEHQPSADQENDFVERHGFAEYANWHLGVDDDHGEETKSRYSFPYGDFERVHRCGLLAAESRAAQYDHTDIEKAAHQLHELIEKRTSS
jgi:hypothetical protein